MPKLVLVLPFRLLDSRTSTGDSCLFLLEPLASDSKPIKITVFNNALFIEFLGSGTPTRTQQHADTHTHTTSRTTHNTTTQHTRAPHTHTSFPGCVLMIHDKLLFALGDESGECTSETAATSKDGSRRANCPILTHRSFCASFLYALFCCASAVEQ